jgi:hypothetical protein
MNSLNVINNGNIMPLLMSFTPSTKIQEETNPFEYTYSDGKQIVSYDMARTVGTRSLKTSSTRKKNGSGASSYYTSASDKKNEIDDSKQVK